MQTANCRFGATCAVLLALIGTPGVQAQDAASLKLLRLVQNPLITVKSSPTLEGNVNGVTVIRVPAWVQRPLGRYYMYFANHMGTFIRLAYAEAPEGPWRIYEPGVLQVRDTAFYRPQPDPQETLENFYTHVASPEIYVDEDRKQLVMWFHGWWTNGERWPSEPREAQRWANQKGYSQSSQAAVSSDGLRFEVRPEITRTSYMRVFRHGGAFYSMSRLGLLSRAATPLAVFETGPNPFRDGPFDRRVRHVAIVPRPGRLLVFFTAIGDAPERVYLTTVPLEGDWTAWRATPATEVLRPEAPYECVDLPNAPSEGGDVNVPVRQIRDPFVFEEGGRSWLFYSTCGEQGIAAASLSLP